MTWDELSVLPVVERRRAFQQINPYEDPPIFAEVKRAFLEKHPEFGPPHEIFVGDVGGLGSLNGIGVRLASAVKLRVPTQFMGLHVSKLVKSGNGWKSVR